MSFYVFHLEGDHTELVEQVNTECITINGIQRSLPTYGIFTESRDSLKELELSTLEILSASSGYKYSTAEIVKNAYKRMPLLNRAASFTSNMHDLK